MFAYRSALVVVLFVAACFARSAHAFFDPPWIAPANPLAGENVSVSIHGGICDWIVSRNGYPLLTRVGNAINLLEYGRHYESGSELCTDTVGTVTRSIGTYPPGDYTLTVDLIYPDPLLGPTIMNIGVVLFTVRAASPPVPLPTSAIGGLITLIMMMIGAGVLAIRDRRARVLVFVFACVPFGAHAQGSQGITATCIIPTTTKGSPTPAQIMAWVSSSPRSATPPLAAFSVKTPLSSTWLIPDRATGDFLAWLNANPNSARKKLEDCVLTTFLTADFPAALAALQADPYVASASAPPNYKFSSVELTDFVVGSDPEVVGGGGGTQYGWYDMNVDAAWQIAGGYALVGQIDMGLYEQHGALRQFDGNNNYTEGNFVTIASKDVGLTGEPAQAGFDPTIVDEKKTMLIPGGGCTPHPDQAAQLPPVILGHGTHAAGLLAANGAAGFNVEGTCKHCGIAMWKITLLECDEFASPPRVQPALNDNAANRAKAQIIDFGVQAVSMSYGAPYDGQNWCAGHRTWPECLAIEYAAGRDVPMIASSGNEREDLNFPASDKRIISAGGFNESDAFWDQYPACPPAFPAECGSNYSTLHSSQTYTHQELLGSAKHVLSTTYTNTTWVDYAECGDGYGTPMGDGLGWCTGTSMSAPQIAGVVGLLRSINPLAPQGTPEPAVNEKAGLRTVLAQTASQDGVWERHVGYGIPNAAKAAERVLGRVDREVVRNRVTPLFRLWEASTKDFADTTSPQFALSLMINQAHNYVQPTSGVGKELPVPGYAFPYDIDDPTTSNDSFDTTPPAQPRAAVYVLTTEYRSRTEWPELLPLYLMEKTYASGRDYMLVTTKTEIETAHNAGYALRTIQGYIYKPCAPEGTCIPPGATKLWRQYRATDNDCAVFLNDEKNAFEAAGYMTACPGGSTTMIGYAYPSLDLDNNGITDNDADSDGLLDGFEYVVGTNPNAQDSDLDGSNDAIEFPMSGIPIGDPCMDGSLGARNCGADIIFKNGFNP